MAKKINLALQGGGAHGAFTWGVLDALLEDGRLEIAAISGTSAGAMNAVVLADGLREGGPARAREKLEQFWRRASLDGSMSDRQRDLFDMFLGAMDPFDVRGKFLDAASGLVSPYQFNPLDINPLRDIVVHTIDFEKLRSSPGPNLYICATNVHTGKIHVFRRDEMTPDMLMASACLPTMFKAVEINGIPYWDGGYSGNPPLYPLFYDSDCADLLLIQINPIARPQTPVTPSQIMNRLNEITFNAPMLGEFRAIEFVARLVEEGILSKARYKNVRMHLVSGGEAMLGYDAATKSKTDFSFMRRLFELGREAGRDFLVKQFERVGVESTYDLREELQSGAPPVRAPEK